MSKPTLPAIAAPGTAPAPALLRDLNDLSFHHLPASDTNPRLRRVTTRFGDQPIFVDVIDPFQARGRERYLEGLFIALGPDFLFADHAVLRRKLIALADDAAATGAQLVTGIDPASVRIMASAQTTRPHLFFTPEVSGLTVARPVTIKNKPAAQWALHLRWAHGRRQCLPLPPYLSLDAPPLDPPPPDAPTPGAGAALPSPPSDDPRTSLEAASSHSPTPNPEPHSLLPPQFQPLSHSPTHILWLQPRPARPQPAGLNSPEPWSLQARQAWLQGQPAPDPADLFRRLLNIIRDFVDFGDEQKLVVLALWALLTYTYTAWEALPYLFITGPSESGKTTLLQLLFRLSFRPTLSSNLTPAALFRSLHQHGGTLLLDETEWLQQRSTESRQLQGLLLAGYKRGGRATRINPGRASGGGGASAARGGGAGGGASGGPSTVEFDVFGPKALASIAAPSATLASRCIPIPMRRAAVESPVSARQMDSDPDRWQSLRDDLHALALEHGHTWPALAAATDRQAARFPAIGGRDRELWLPLLALAGWLEEAGVAGLLSGVYAHAQQCIGAAQMDKTPAVDEVLLQALAVRVAAGQSPTAAELLRDVRAQDPEAARLLHGSPRSVAVLLKRYGITTSAAQNRRYHVAMTALRDLEQRYRIGMELPPLS